MVDTLNSILIVATSVMFILTIIGCSLMLKFSFVGRTANNSTMKSLICNLSISNLLVGAISMPCNMYALVCKDKASCNIACLSRYFFTFIFSNNSLIVLAALCHLKRDLIIKVPFGKAACVTPSNRTWFMLISGLISFVPNLALSVGYLYLMITENTAPCQPDEKHKRTTHYYLGISEGLKTGIVFGVCFTTIIRDVSKLRKTLASQAERVKKSTAGNRQDTTAKVNANLYFAVVFIVMWIPFSIIAAFASYIPPAYYQDAFTIGYTLAYTSFALLPICYGMTDSNFKEFCKQKLFIISIASDCFRSQQPLNTVQPVKAASVTKSECMK